MRDLRYALRVLAKTPVVTFVAVISLALGIGANTAIFSVINALILRPLPVPHPEQLAAVATISPESNSEAGPLSLAMLEHMRASQQVFSGMCAWGYGFSNFDVNGATYRANVVQVSGDFFAVLGVTPALGRLIGPEDVPLGAAASPQIAVLDYRSWQNRYHGDPNVVGQQIRIDGRSFSIVGVTPQSYTGLLIDSGTEAAVPLGFTGTEAIRDRKFLTLSVIGRMKPGMSLAQARAQIETLWPATQKATVPDNYAGAARARFFRRRISIESEAAGTSSLRIRYRKALMVLIGLTGMVLLIACVNLANLMLARAAARQHEMGVRAALGAGAWRLVRQLLTESVILALSGAALGFLAAIWTARLLLNTMWLGFIPQIIDPAPDLRVVAFTAAVALTTGILFGLAPAWRAMRSDPLDSLRQNTRAVRGGGAFAKALVSAQVALSMVMLIAAALFVHSLRNIRSADLGFRRDGILAIQLFPQPGREKLPHRAHYYRELIEKITQLPGVSAATYSESAPVANMEYPSPVASPFVPLTEAVTDVVGPGFFQLLGVRLLAGREFTWHDDAKSPSVAVISQSLAQRLFPGTDPLGQKVDLYPGPAHKTFTVVGVAGSASLWMAQSHQPAALFMARLQDPSSNTPLLLLRVAGDPLAIAAAARKAIESMGNSYPLRIQTLEQRSDYALLQERMIAILSMFFGGLAVLLACIGLYGLMAYSVTRRTPEIGIRMALGAERGKVVSMILREVLLLVGLGVLAGVPAALAASRLVSGMLFDLAPNDPATIAPAALILLSVAMFAGYWPARRASRIEPSAALRAE